MRKVFFTLAFCLGLITFANAQSTLQENLSKHVHYLASDDMKGRAVGSKELDRAADYIKKELKAIGLEVVDYPIRQDSLDGFIDGINGFDDDIVEEVVVEEPIEKEIITYNCFYAVIPALNAPQSDKYTMISVSYNGSGVDTIKQYEIISNSANEGASGTAAVIELTKYFKENQNKLKKNVIVMFSGCATSKSCATYLAKHFDKGTIEMYFNLFNLGYLRQPSDESQYEYNVSENIQNAGKILQPILLKDVNLPTSATYDYWTLFPQISINGDYLAKYRDVADSLNYDMMEKIVNQSKEVILAFNTNDLEIIAPKEDSKLEDDLMNNFTSQLLGGKNKSYFGLNLMIGSNKHYYTEGKMTGKAAMSYSAGLFFKWQLSNLWALKLDANYERAFANRHDGRWESNVLSVPLTFMLSTGSRSGEFFLGIGGYYDYNLSAKLEGNDVDWDDFNRGEWGWQWSIGYRIGHFMMGYYQKLGLSDIMNRDLQNMGKIKNRNQYFTIGWKF